MKLPRRVLINLIVLVVVILTLSIFVQPRSCSTPIEQPSTINYDSIKKANGIMLVKIAEKNHIISRLGDDIDSLKGLKSKVIYKTKYKSIIENHDTCVVYFDSCVKDLDLCNQIIKNQDTIIETKTMIVNMVTAENTMLDSFLNKSVVDLNICNAKTAKQAKKIKNKNKGLFYLASAFLIENIIIYLVK
jgi:hypothetical protein